jgi:hypothetical protein
VLLAFVGAGLSVRRHRIYGLLCIAAGLWLIQTGLGVGVVVLEYLNGNSSQSVPAVVRDIGPGLLRAGQSVLQLLAWLAIAAALLWPRGGLNFSDAHALPEDAVA